MAAFKVVITDYEYETLTPEQEVLEAMDVEFVPTQCKTEQEVIDAAKDADGIINQYAPITKKVIQNLNNCKVIARYGVGVDTINLEAATDKGISVCNVTDYCIDEVSDHAFSLLLAAARKVVQLNNSVKSETWNFNIGKPIFRLRGSTLGLVGFGNIPQTLAKKALAFGINVIAYDPFVLKEVAEKLGVKLIDLDELCKISDFISVHAPLNERTKGMINYHQFYLMKKSAFIINTARGPIIDETALIQALKEEKIAGAGLDVVEKEPIEKDHPFLTMDHATLTPHVAWYSEEAEDELKRQTAQNVVDVLSEKKPRYLVNTEVQFNHI